MQELGRRATTPHFTFLVARTAVLAPGEPPGPVRLGLVVTKKIGNAVTRNRIKRLCRECFRTTPKLAPDGVDLVVIARPGADGLGLEGVRAEWKRVKNALWKRAEEALAHAAATTHVSAVRKPRPA